MKHYEAGKSLIVFAVLGIVALLIVGALSTGPDSWTAQLDNVNASSCPTGNCTESEIPNNVVLTVAGVIVPIIFFIAIVLKMI